MTPLFFDDFLSRPYLECDISAPTGANALKISPVIVCLLAFHLVYYLLPILQEKLSYDLSNFKIGPKILLSKTCANDISGHTDYISQFLL